MATQSLLMTALKRGSAVTLNGIRTARSGATSSGVHRFSHLSANKESKDTSSSDKSGMKWTDKEHEEWVDRRFGHLKKWSTGKEEKASSKAIAKKKSQ